MTWTTFHHRGDVLRTVIRAADARMYRAKKRRHAEVAA